MALVALVVACQGREEEEPGVSPEQTTESVDLLVRGARIWTGDENDPWAEAVAVAGDRIVAVGSDDELAPLADRAGRVIDAAGATVAPGFIDTHVHFLDGGFRLSSVQLRDAATPEEFAQRIAEFAATVPTGTWILGGDWDHENWGGELPHRDWIDDLVPEHPVWVNRLDGHMALASSLALERAGVDAATAVPEGGEIERDETGRITGILRDNAMPLVDRVVPEPSDAQEDTALDAAMRYVASHGVTSVHNMGTWEQLEVFRRAHAAGRLQTRIYAAVPLATWERLAETVQREGRGDEWLRTGLLKGFVDGSLGSHTAAFLADYSDEPGERGLFVTSEEDLRQRIGGADAEGLHVTVHAIGDHAVRTLLDLFEEAAAANGPRDRRFRMEHAQHVHPDDLDRFAELEVIPSMQPYHAIDDGRWAERVIGAERSATTYPFGSLLERGARLAFGSDWFVAPPIPLLGLDAAVNRRTLDGANPDGWYPEQRIGLEPALRAYTRDAAYSSFEERLKGTIEVGKLADLVVLDRDLFADDGASLAEAAVRYTVVGGEVVYEAE
ncbi:MAG: amidohydrolase [Acidobacteria bacterium]|nr:MAG: amidohydrolase [Acidobacteriota bacterium]REK03355.1 MAG: amidohydrolase [Acidobacteriota bacterium]